MRHSKLTEGSRAILSPIQHHGVNMHTWATFRFYHGETPTASSFTLTLFVQQELHTFYRAQINSPAVNERIEAMI
jgi:hypothetical protein